MSICEICGNKFDMGYNGSIYGCDECAGAFRNEDGEMSIPYNIVNNELPDGIELIPDPIGEYEYVLRFYDESITYDDPLVKAAQNVVARYRNSEWLDHFME